MKKDTKTQILEEAVKCFNQSGYGAVSLHEIAQNLDMTRGNLTYHFKDKETLLQAVVKEMWTQIKEEKDKIGSFPSFHNLQEQSKAIYKIQKNYAFIFLDGYVVNQPSVRQQFQRAAAKNYEDMKAAIAVSIQMGNIKPESHPGIYNSLAYVISMMNVGRLKQELLKGKNKELDVDRDKVIWSLFQPHFTGKGKAAFIKFFGKNYYDKLGESFQADISSIIGF